MTDSSFLTAIGAILTDSGVLARMGSNGKS